MVLQFALMVMLTGCWATALLNSWILSPRDVEVSEYDATLTGLYTWTVTFFPAISHAAVVVPPESWNGYSLYRVRPPKLLETA
jgi:hypothetical protein